MGKITEIDRSVIPACDVDLPKLDELVRETADIEKISAYKIGFFLGLKYGLPKTVETIRNHTNKPIIYDHQKSATDIPDTGKIFANACKESGIDVVIFFPQAGPATQKAWIQAAYEEKLGVIVGGLMTHPQYKQSEGGYLSDEGIYKIYENAAEMGIEDFVVPGNKPDEIVKIKELLESKGVNPSFYSPGLVSQGGDISETTKVAGNSWHAIVGRGLYQAKNMKEVAKTLVSQL